MAKPKEELIDISTICGVTHAYGSIMLIENEKVYHLKEIEKMRKALLENASFEPFKGFSPTKISELSDEIKGHFWCIKLYDEALEKINEKFFNTQEN